MTNIFIINVILIGAAVFVITGAIASIFDLIYKIANRRVVQKHLPGVYVRPESLFTFAKSRDIIAAKRLFYMDEISVANLCAIKGERETHE